MEHFYQKNTFLSYYDGQKVDEPVFCTIRTLTGLDGAKMMRLQQTILTELGENQTFISVNKPKDFLHYLRRKNGAVLGVFDNQTGKLIAMQMLKLSHNPDVDIPSITTEPVACLASFMVDKKFRGNHLTPILMGRLMRIAETKFGVKNFIAYVDAHNPASYTHFLQAGFGISHAYIDDVFHAKSYAFISSPDKKVNDKLYFPDKILGVDDFETVQQKLRVQKICSAKQTVRGNDHVNTR